MAAESLLDEETLDGEMMEAKTSAARLAKYMGTTPEGSIKDTGRERTILGLPAPKFGMLVAWLVYIAAAMFLNPDKSWPLLVATLACLLFSLLSKTGKLAEMREHFPTCSTKCKWAVLCLLALGIVGVVFYDMSAVAGTDVAIRLRSAFGMLVLVGGCILVSYNRSGTPWTTIASGLLLQFYLGYFVMKTELGFSIFDKFGEIVDSFLKNSQVGSAMVFGDGWAEHFFAFGVLPVVIFFSTFVSVVYYCGILQICVRVIACALKALLGTSLVQSVNSAANMFLGQTEAPLLIKPFLGKATPCDIHCVMTGGFASIAGSVLGAYIGMGISPTKLIGASVMSVPGTLVVANLVCPPGSLPELDVGGDVDDSAEESDGDYSHSVSRADDFEFPPPAENNVVEAAGNGASMAIDLVLNIGAMLIAFCSIISACDALLGTLGTYINVDDLSFDLICGYLFWPLAYIMGTPRDNCQIVATLIGNKVFVNEFFAYDKLSKFLETDGLSPRAEIIATYALCGFANFGSVGMQLGVFSALYPERKPAFARLVVPAMISGNVVCFINACVAGIFN